ncbi:DUF2570 family protein [Haemophilus haemoglobinophilus]|nr:DUF2570 family protein [Canicola haemoglobinophilus]MBN6711426.1 DUF2570 family protein [Canicola haemoglobinophilus]
MGIFNSLGSAVILTALLLILGLGVWSWRQSQIISSLQATNQTQAQTISQLEQNQEILNQQLQAEQKAVEQQQKLVNQFKSQAESKREKVRVIFKDNQCANTHLPSGVIEQLQ